MSETPRPATSTPASSTPATVSDAKPCKVCGEAIKRSARKCIHCDSYQDWHANIGMSTTVLSLLVALVAVLTPAVPVMKTTFSSKNSSLSFSLQGVDETLLVFLLQIRVQDLGQRRCAPFYLLVCLGRLMYRKK
jgi:hypothetical protein